MLFLSGTDFDVDPDDLGKLKGRSVYDAVLAFV